MEWNNTGMHLLLTDVPVLFGFNDVSIYSINNLHIPTMP